jgi:hypothetical protein
VTTELDWKMLAAAYPHDGQVERCKYFRLEMLPFRIELWSFAAEVSQIRIISGGI